MNLDAFIGRIVLGVGTDIVDVERIRQAHEKHGERFLGRIYTEEEKAYCFQMKNPYPHLAARFAAKEAVSKAFTTGIGESLHWKSVSIYHGSRNEPLVRLDDVGKALLAQVGGSDILVSLSHTATIGHAVALLAK